MEFTFAQKSEINQALRDGNLKKLQEIINDSNVNYVLDDSNNLNILNYYLRLFLPNEIRDKAIDDSDLNEYRMLVPDKFNIEIAKFLLSEGIDPNSYTSTNTTALLSAIESEEIELAEILLEFGADANQVDKDGVSALQLAIKENNSELIKMLIAHEADTDGSIMYALSQPNFKIETLKAFIDSGVSVNTKKPKSFDVDDKQPLFVAIQERKGKEVVSLLIESGALINQLCFYSDTKQKGGKVRVSSSPLQEAIVSGQDEIINILLDQGAYVLYQNSLLSNLSKSQKNIYDRNQKTYDFLYKDAVTDVIEDDINVTYLVRLLKINGIPPQVTQSKFPKTYEEINSHNDEVKSDLEIPMKAILHQLRPNEFASPAPESILKRDYDRPESKKAREDTKSKILNYIQKLFLRKGSYKEILGVIAYDHYSVKSLLDGVKKLVLPQKQSEIRQGFIKECNDIMSNPLLMAMQLRISSLENRIYELERRIKGPESEKSPETHGVKTNQTTIDKFFKKRSPDEQQPDTSVKRPKDASSIVEEPLQINKQRS